MTWDIIVWDKEDAIDFVPSSWANEDNTLYKHPTIMSDTKIRQLIYNCQDFNSEQQYKWSKASVKKLRVKTLKQAKELCKKGQFSSDIENLPSADSDVNDESQGKRKRKRNRKFVVESEDEQDDSEDSSDEGEIEYTKTIFKVPSTPKSKNTEQKQTSAKGALGPNKNKESRKDEHITPQPTSVSTKTRNGTPEINDDLEVDDNVVISDNNSLSGGLSLPSTLSCSSSSGETSFFKEFARNVLRNQASIEFKLQRLEKAFECLENRLLRNQDIAPQEESILINLLPCSSMQDVDLLENSIKEDKAKYCELVNLLYLVGGETVHKSTYAVLRKLLKNEVCLLFSGQGKKHKLSFSKLTLNNAVAAAVRKRHSSATDDEIKKTISTYLAQTKARMSVKQN